MAIADVEDGSIAMAYNREFGIDGEKRVSLTETPINMAHLGHCQRPRRQRARLVKHDVAHAREDLENGAGL